MFILGLWPLIFNDAPPSDEEVAETMYYILFGIVAFIWGGIVCYGSYQMSTIGSYPWAFVGAVFGLVPLLAGIFSIITLKDPRVIAGYIEPEAGPNAVRLGSLVEPDRDPSGGERVNVSKHGPC